MATKQQHDRPEDCATAWFAVLERARLDGNKKREEQALRELQRLGVLVGFVTPAEASR